MRRGNLSNKNDWNFFVFVLCFSFIIFQMIWKITWSGWRATCSSPCHVSVLYVCVFVCAHVIIEFIFITLYFLWAACREREREKEGRRRAYIDDIETSIIYKNLKKSLWFIIYTWCVFLLLLFVVVVFRCFGIGIVWITLHLKCASHCAASAVVWVV